MKKLVVSLMIGLVSVFVMAANDPAQKAFDDAMSIWKTSTNGAVCQAAFEKFQQDFPSASPRMLAQAQVYVGRSLWAQNKFADAEKAFAIVNDKYTSDMKVSRHTIGSAQYYRARMLLVLNKETEAIVIFEDVIKNCSSVGSWAAHSQVYLGNIMKKNGDIIGSQKAYMAAVQNNVWLLGAKDETGLMWTTFLLIDPRLISQADYKAFLENTIKATKATEDNAKFLGRLKSELEKMK